MEDYCRKFNVLLNFDLPHHISISRIGNHKIFQTVRPLKCSRIDLCYKWAHFRAGEVLYGAMNGLPNIYGDQNVNSGFP